MKFFDERDSSFDNNNNRNDERIPNKYIKEKEKDKKVENYKIFFVFHNWSYNIK
jgi:hypothetical protein